MNKLATPLERGNAGWFYRESRARFYPDKETKPDRIEAFESFIQSSFHGLFGKRYYLLAEKTETGVQYSPATEEHIVEHQIEVIYPPKLEPETTIGGMKGHNTLSNVVKNNVTAQEGLQERPDGRISNDTPKYRRPYSPGQGRRSDKGPSAADVHSRGDTLANMDVPIERG